MIKIENCVAYYDESLPAWWCAGGKVRVIHKDNTFFIYQTPKSKLHNQHNIGEDKNLELEDAPDGWYELMVHSEFCIGLVYNRSLDSEPKKAKTLDPRTATETDLNYWIFEKARDALESGHILKGFADAVKVMKDAFHTIKTETKSLEKRPMETREIVVESDSDEDDED